MSDIEMKTSIFAISMLNLYCTVNIKQIYQKTFILFKHFQNY
jgi:hypothetical protein